MAEYRVGVITTVEDYNEYIVEADSEDEAENLALERAYDEASTFDAFHDIVKFEEVG